MKLKSIILLGVLISSLFQLLTTEITYSAVPTVKSVTPSTAPADSLTSVTIKGANFEPGAKVSLINGGPFLVGSLKAFARDVYVLGDYAYLISFKALIIVDISDPAAPEIIGSISVASWTNGLYVSGNYAYVAEGEPYYPYYEYDGESPPYSWTGLEIIDISDPTTPTIVGSVATAGAAYDVYVSEDYAYVAEVESNFSGWQGLEVIDIKKPASPKIVGSYKISDDANAVYVLGDYAYIASLNSSGLKVMDISHPTAPKLIASAASVAYDVYVSGKYAYVAESEGVQVLDISNPASPIGVSFIYTSKFISDLHLAGAYLYMINEKGLFIADVSDPAAPIMLGDYTGLGFTDVYVLNNYAYVVGDNFWVVDIKVPDSPVSIVGSIKTTNNLSAMYVSGDYAYLTDLKKGLQLIDISNPTSPVRSGFFETPGFAFSVYVLGNYAYVGQGPNTRSGLQIVDISDPSAPILVGAVETSGSVNDVYVLGDYAYLTHGGIGLVVVDISDPFSPTITGSIETDGGLGVYVSGDYAYLGLRDLKIIDISDPTYPKLISAFDTNDFTVVSISGNYAYVAGTFKGLQVIDISDPTSPTLVGSINPPGFSWDIYVSGNYAYVASRRYGLQVIDISDPELPVRAGSFEIPGETISVHVSDGYAYTGGDTGVHVVKINDPVADIMVIDSNTITASFPADLPEGYYDVVVTNTSEQREEGVLHNGFGSGVFIKPDITITDSVLPIGDLQIPFGYVSHEKASDQTVRITNDGGADLIISTIAQTDALDAPFSITADACSNQTLAPFANCSLTVRFKPTVPGSFSDTFDIPSNDPDESSVTISVSGSKRRKNMRHK